MKLRARWVYTGIGPPLSDAVVTIEGARIQSVDSTACGPLQELGDVAIVPGLINAHTHLEFSDFTTPVEPLDRFADWIRAVISSRQQRYGSQADASQRGLCESVQSGVTGLAEIATTNWPLEAGFRSTQPHLFVFREILGLRPEGIAGQLHVAQTFLQQAREAGITDVGLSPHAPYSLHPDLFRGLCDLAVDYQIPLAMHLAESPTEMELLQQGTGPLVELFTQMGLWKADTIPVPSRPLQYLQALARAPRALVIHGNALAADELDFLATQPQMSVVWCPRTFHAMQKAVHPWREMIARGINVTLGTDSRASNPNLHLWEELLWLKSTYPELKASELLPLSTANAAQALGWKTRGTLAVGQDADFCIVPLSKTGVVQPEDFLFENAITQVYIAGQRVQTG